MLKINEEGTFIDGIQISDVKLSSLDLDLKQWKFRISVLEDAENVGGVTLFGSYFRNYNQNLVFRVYYDRRLTEAEIAAATKAK